MQPVQTIQPIQPTNKSKITFIAAVIAGCAILFSFASVDALDKKAQLKLGEMEYLSNCGSCHGRDAKGDGPIAAILTVKPSDLTMISKKSDGKFPLERIYKTINGRDIIKAHGDSLMPVWGRRFMVMEREVADAIAYPPDDLDTQSLVFGRIMSLVGYLESIQVKDTSVK
jgi:mono/diheme cytochrome c family protein